MSGPRPSQNQRDLMSMSHVLMQGRLSLAVLVAMAVAPGMSGGGKPHATTSATQ